MADCNARPVIWAIIQDIDREPVTPNPTITAYLAARRRLQELDRQEDLAALDRAVRDTIEQFVRVRGTGLRLEADA